MKPTRVVRLLLHSAFCLLPSLCFGYGNLQFFDAHTNIVNTLWDERQYNSTAFSNGIPWLLNTNGLASSTLPDVTPGQLQYIVSNAFLVWQAAPETKIRFCYGGQTTNQPSGTYTNTLPPDPALDGDNVIGFGSLSSGVLGLTCQFILDDQFTFTSTNNSFGGTDLDPDIPEGTYPAGTILDADILISSSENWSVTGEYGMTDLQAVLTHEIGHFIGLCHSVVGAPYPAVMFPFAELNPDGLSGRDLKADDKAGVAAYYPSPTFSTTFGSISGQVTRQDNSNGVPSAHVVATLSNDLSQVIGVYSDASGVYRIEGLVPGNYIVRVEPLPKSATAYSAGDRINEIVESLHDVDFFPQVFNQTASETDATLITVSAGNDSTNRNFQVADGDGADPFEDDDSPGTARMLSTAGRKEFHNIYPAGDIDYFTFTGVAGKEYLIRTTDYGRDGADNPYQARAGVAYVVVTDQSGKIVAAQKEDGTDSWISFLPEQTATYYVSVKHWTRTHITSDAQGTGTQYAISILERVPSIYYVSSTGGSDATGSGSSANPWATIGYALSNTTATANQPLSIFAASGMYPEHLSVRSHVSLYGGFHPTSWARNPDLYPTIVDGGATGIVAGVDDRSRIDGLTIQNGNVGVETTGEQPPSPIVMNNVIRGNTNAGAGVYLVGSGAPILLGNLICSNSAVGGIHIQNCVPLVQGNRIIRNETRSGSSGDQQGGGAGIRIWQPTYDYSAEIISNEIVGNKSAYYGGGIACINSSLERIARNIIVGNSAAFGGALYTYYSPVVPTVEENVIASNHADKGAGLAFWEGDVIVRGNKIIGNSSPLSAVGLWFYSGFAPTTRTINNVFVGNWSPTNSVIAESGSYSARDGFVNNTIAYNQADGVSISSVYQSYAQEFYLYNNVIACNSGYGVRETVTDADPQFSFNNIFGNGLGGYYDDDTTNTYTTATDINTLVDNGPYADAADNVDWNPGFKPAPTGTASGIAYNSAKFQSVLTDSAALFVPNALAGLTVNPNTNQWLHFYIITNTTTTITTWGDMTSAATAPCSYQVFDYHLAGDSQNINAGMNIPVLPGQNVTAFLTNDIDGESRPFGVAFDIGADEFFDSDGDMLADYWEQRYSLSSTNADTDGDSMNDGWELAYRNPWLAQNGNVDPDGDGMSDLFESIAGTNPNDATSLLRMIGVTPHTTGSVDIFWTSVRGKKYKLFVTTNLVTTAFGSIGGTNIATAATTSFTDTSTNSALKFYKVQVLP